MTNSGPLAALLLAVLLPLALLSGCASGGDAENDGRIQAVATTSIVADMVRQIGGEHVNVQALMGPNVDPHVYRPSEGDVTRMATADIVFTNGMHLEGKMGEALEQLSARGTVVRAIAEAIPDSLRRESLTYQGSYDPHVWMNPRLWIYAANETAAALADLDPEHAAEYQANATATVDSLEALDLDLRERIALIPEDRRVLVTAHDAFEYFGRAYGFEVRGLQGLSTATEAGTADVQNLARFVTEKGLPTMFVETSVSERTIRAVQEAVRARGGTVELGEPLYSDALGGPASGADTIFSMLRHNVDAMVDGLGT